MNVEMRPNGPFGPKGEDAITLLEADHKRVRDLFSDIAKLEAREANVERKASLVKQLCNELEMHAVIEETIFYPAVRALIDDEELMEEARAQHADIRKFVAELEAMDFSSGLYDDTLALLQEQVTHHISEEEEIMFPEARDAIADGVALGDQMAQRKVEMMVDTKASATALRAASIQDALREKS